MVLTPSYAAQRGIAFHDISHSFFTEVGQRIDEFQHIVDNADLEMESEIYHFLRGIMPETKNPVFNEMTQNFVDFHTNYFTTYCQHQPDPIECFLPVYQEIYVETEELMRSGRIDRVSYVPGTTDYYIMDYKTGRSWNVSDLRKELSFYYSISQELEFLQDRVTHWSIYNPNIQRVLFEPIKKISITWMEKTIVQFKEALPVLRDDVLFEEFWKKNKKKFLNPIKCIHCEVQEECWF
jgi:ATP-dependent exoDNAse (exonuclease V) beta subunit